MAIPQSLERSHRALITLPVIENVESIRPSEGENDLLDFAIDSIAANGTAMTWKAWKRSRGVFQGQITRDKAAVASAPLNWKAIGIGAAVGAIAFCILFSTLSFLVFLIGAALGGAAGWQIGKLLHSFQTQGAKDRATQLEGIVKQVDTLFANRRA